MSISGNEYIAENPVIDATAQGFLDALASQTGPAIYELSISDARGVLSGAQAGPVDKMPADIEDKTLPVGPTGEVTIRIVRPAGNTSKLPVVMYFHGGGWVLGDKETHDRLIREIANCTDAAVVFVDYVRSPEAHYPVAIEQAYAATKWIAENGGELNLDGSNLVVAGDSVGGNMAAVTCLLAKERGGPEIKFQAMFYPVTDANFETSSYHQYATGHFLDREGMKWFWDMYAPDTSVRNEVHASPLLASIEHLRGLPDALVITGECDVLRDEGEAYAGRLAEAGVRVTAVRFLGMIHDFVMLNVLAQTPAARGAISLATTMLRSALGR